jgi:Ca2+:H+ antiporter
MFEVAILLGSCFLVNYVTADAKTNWAEGVAMVTFYIMIVSLPHRSNFRQLAYICFQALCAWFYTGQPEIRYLSRCESVAVAIAAAATGNTTGHAAE